MTAYVSTRDPGLDNVSYSEALLAGLAPDGGLYVPTEVPQLDAVHLRLPRDEPYWNTFRKVHRLFVDTISGADQVQIAREAYDPANFPEAINGNALPVQEVQPGLFMQDLSGGPTAAFKDAAMQPLAREIDLVLGSKDQKLEIIGATSGDTGSAAEAAFAGRSRITSLFMLSPTVGMSKFQQAQMGNLSGGNIVNISVEGRFDDCQDLVKEIQTDPEFSELGGVNSINWGRISAQVPYYVSGYLQVIAQSKGSSVGDPVDFVVPTGNFGNILAGFIARQTGLPIGRLIAATNENAVVHNLIQTGVYQTAPAQVTSSPSMDISKASNYERVVYHLLGRDPIRTASYMGEFAAKGRVDLTDFGLPADSLKRAGFESGASNHQRRLWSIAWVYEKTGQVIDPHTADGISVANDLRRPDVPMVVLSTARAVKFEPTIYKALGFVPPRPERFADLKEGSSEGFTSIKPDLEVLKTLIRRRRSILATT